ncbi:kinesin motor domain protein [Ichthyophthirius multifiliis]|uniref:Kinesin motor domain protein n=1 Tax=Ichthyophthirius multifiliis TaxID=5932 RepID=G0QPW9_ICHMU|nr:kinesin motor domain protein [Ichthyophthirius multifiliis]EGR32747.1 kinesin motor domain protein [Ichthyophthirius multifiliis]|eukprot:XP_004036733.1 kinesin motor domain protein [Ichthyophthirius multifiliis]
MQDSQTYPEEKSSIQVFIRIRPPNEREDEQNDPILALPAADNCLEGYNACIFAYGQTGAGKTYTITGGGSIEQVLNTEKRGLLPRVLEYIFEKLETREKSEENYLVKCSYLEIYNEKIIDLLMDNGQTLQLREDLKKGVYVENLSEKITQSLSQAIEILKNGGRNRHIGITSMNRESSRSHSVFSITVQQKKQQYNNNENQQISFR